MGLPIGNGFVVNGGEGKDGVGVVGRQKLLLTFVVQLEVVLQKLN